MTETISWPPKSTHNRQLRSRRVFNVCKTDRYKNSFIINHSNNFKYMFYCLLFFKCNVYFVWVIIIFLFYFLLYVDYYSNVHRTRNSAERLRCVFIWINDFFFFFFFFFFFLKTQWNTPHSLYLYTNLIVPANYTKVCARGKSKTTRVAHSLDMFTLYYDQLTGCSDCFTTINWKQLYVK